MSSHLLRRVIGFTAVVVFFLFAVILLLADRSASIVPEMRRVIVGAGRQFERTYDVDVVDRSDIPGTADQLGHAALWGTGMFLVGWLLRRRVPVALTALCMAAVSLAFEATQPIVSTTRAFQPSDAVANMTGILGASIALTAVLWGWRLTRAEIMSADDRSFLNR